MLSLALDAYIRKLSRESAEDPKDRTPPEEYLIYLAIGCTVPPELEEDARRFRQSIKDGCKGELESFDPEKLPTSKAILGDD